MVTTTAKLRELLEADGDDLDAYDWLADYDHAKALARLVVTLSEVVENLLQPRLHVSKEDISVARKALADVKELRL